jgi:hypothetical protein
MKQQLRSLLLIISFSVLFYGKTYGQDLLDNVKSSSKLVTELKDLFRACHINNIITNQKEMINLNLDDSSDEEMKTLLDGYIKTCDSLKIVRFKDGKLSSYITKYLALTIQSYRIAQAKGITSA